MTIDEMAELVEERCKRINAVFRNEWEWGTNYEEFSKDCGVSVARPEFGGPKDKAHPIRKRFTRAMRTVIRQDDYSLEQVALRKLELVEAIQNFKP